MSADADRIDECTRCHAPMSMDDGCEPTDVCHHCAHARVQELTAELAEARKQIRLKDEALKAMADTANVLSRLRDEEREAAVERDTDHERTKALVASKVETIARLYAERDAAQAEAAAMRQALLHAKRVGYASNLLDESLNGTAGRDLAARVPLLEAVLTTGRTMLRKFTPSLAEGKTFAAAVAALDAKGGG